MADLKDLDSQVEETIEELSRVKAEIAKCIFGQDKVIEEVLVALLSGGHGLLVGVPGLAKTRLVETLGMVLGLAQKRVQFTPDLMPADILGSEILDEGNDGKQAFRFIKGPVFTQLLMADEINRASPRTQAALLQAMQEREVTIAGHAYQLPTPFHVLATQNPIEQEGTYPLPEAQLDRFLLQVNLTYPTFEAEREILIATTTGEEASPSCVLDPGKLIAMQQLVRRMPVGQMIVDAILRLVRSGRPEHGAHEQIRNWISWGPGPRASQALMLAVRARALLQGRLAPSLEDISELAAPVLRHRMAVTFTARADGVEPDEIVQKLVELAGGHA